MSLLTPLYMLGLAAISLPILFHLIRRTPRGRFEFSSLMFLAPSPPRLTRRSRLDNLLLLLLRGLALALLAFAFARPFLRESANLAFDSARGRRIAILVDTSASMRRGDLWQRAKQQVREAVAELEPADDVALFTFDESVNSLIDFDQEASLDRTAKFALISERLDEVELTWASTDLGTALVTAADLLDVHQDLQQLDAAMQIIVVSDVQKGAQIESLHSYEWPETVFVSVMPVSPLKRTNASLRLLDDDAESGEDLRVRVSNAADSVRNQFFVKWSNLGDGTRTDDSVAIEVPAGQSRVIRLARDPVATPSDHLVLNGDDHPFDNTFYTVVPPRETIQVVYIGSDKAGDPEGLRFFLEVALENVGHHDIEFVAPETDAAFDLSSDSNLRLVVVARTVSPDRLEELKKYLAAGGTVLVVPQDQDSAVQLASFDQSIDVVGDGPALPRNEYAMLGEIDFTHPVFADFATADYNDFTKIHFWNRHQFEIREDSTARVVARFDDGYPALWEQSVENGTIFALTSGWRLADSQLALSSKFVPLMIKMLEQAAGASAVLPTYHVNDAIELPGSGEGEAAIVQKPDGSIVSIGSDADRFDGADQPGTYDVRVAGQPYKFAVNLLPSESLTAAMDIQQLEQFGVRIGKQATRSEEIDRQRQLRDTELENRQQVWRWLIFAALGVLVCETWLAGRKSNLLSKQNGEAR